MNEFPETPKSPELFLKTFYRSCLICNVWGFFNAVFGYDLVLVITGFIDRRGGTITLYFSIFLN